MLARTWVESHFGPWHCDHFWSGVKTAEEYRESFFLSLRNTVLGAQPGNEAELLHSTYQGTYESFQEILS
jgi:hypothetical protein